MPVDIGEERRGLVAALRARARPAKPGFDLQAYLGSPLPVLGVTTPDLRVVMGGFQKAHRDLTAPEVNALAAAMWSGATWEERVCGISLLDRYASVLDEDSWRLMDGWVEQATGWALSDGLASGPISKSLQARPARFREVLRWTRAGSFWRRRASTYAMNEWIRAGELDRPFELLERLLYDDEFWVQRAVGTWLRECWKKDRTRTEAFLRKHVRGLPPVMITVATERATKAFREELRRATRVGARTKVKGARRGKR